MVHGEPKSELEIFQTLVGINFLAKGGAPRPHSGHQVRPANPIADIFLPSRTAKNRFRNRGVYDRALSQDLKNRLMYSLSHYVIASLYILQILLAATFTALSAYRASSDTVDLTVLGAINTVVAGLLAWLMGQGMPVRFRLARDQCREVVHAIEMAERTFAEIDYHTWAEGTRPNPLVERDNLEAMYGAARMDQEANYPESYRSPGSELKAKQQEQKVDDADKEELQTLRKQLAELKGMATERVKSSK